MTETPQCKFKDDEHGAIEADGEVKRDDGTVVCEADAVCRVRPKGGRKAAAFGAKVPMCEPHALYLVEDAPADWDMLERFAYE